MRVLLTLLLAASGQASSWHSLLTADLGIFTARQHVQIVHVAIR